MKFEWDSKYLKISLYVIFTAITIYVLSKLVDSAAFILVNLGYIKDGILGVLGYLISVLSVLIMAFVIAYIFDPVVDFFQDKYEHFYRNRMKPFIQKRFGKWLSKVRARIPAKEKPQLTYKKRTSGTVITYMTLILLLFFAIRLLISRMDIKGGGSLADAGKNLAQGIVDFVNKSRIDLSDFATEAQLTLADWGAVDYVTDIISSIVNSITGIVNSFATNIVGTVASAGSGILDFFLALVVAFYFLRDKESINKKIQELLNTFFNSKAERLIKNAFGDIHAVFSGYIRGQLIDAAIMGFLISAALSIIGVDFAMFIGIFSGLSNLIPYFGAITGLILSIVVALLSGDPMKAVWAAIVILVLQQLDGIFIVPKVVGEKVELSPALVLLSLSIFGSMFGILGMVFAVPACAIIKIFLTRFTQRHKKNRLEKEAHKKELKIE